MNATNLINALRKTAQPADAFCGEKVYISAAHTLASKAGLFGGTLASFKLELLAMLRAGEIELSRGDLVMCMGVGKLRASQMQVGFAEWHFVRIAG